MLFALCIFAFSCSSDDSDNTSNNTIKGEIYGSSFTAAGGQAFASGDNLSVNITNVSADCSLDIINYDLYITTIVTPEVSTNNNAEVFFYAIGESVYELSGATVEVVAISDDEITVSISANSNLSDNNLEGTFTVPICD